jgi:hypothetical protein
MHRPTRAAFGALVVTLALGLPSVAAPAPAPPLAALAMLQDSLQVHGRKSGFDADYGAINRALLARLADAIDLVETGPKPARPGERIEPVLATWRTLNREFVQQLTRDSAALQRLSDQPIRYRLAQQALYELIVQTVRKNAACMRDLAGEWASEAAPSPGQPG